MFRSLSKIIKMCELGWVPIPFENDLEWSVADALVNRPELQEGMPTENVVLSKLQNTQRALKPAKVEALVAARKIDGALVLERDNICHVFDGHHRAEAAKVLGYDVISANIWHLDSSPMDLERCAQTLNCTTEDILSAMSTDDRRVYEGSK